MTLQIVDQVVEFYDELFRSIFFERFKDEITDRLRRRSVERDIAESADAASQSLSRFFLNQRIGEEQATHVLDGLARLGQWIELGQIANPNVAPESLAAAFDDQNPCPDAIVRCGGESAYRVALEAVVQVLTLVGPVMGEWRKVEFSRAFELLDRVVARLNEISRRMSSMAESALDVEDERFELSYRDYLLQRFFRVEAGTVKMTTNVNVDLPELFVMPRVLPRARLKDREGMARVAVDELMDLAKARQAFQDRHEQPDEDKEQEPQGITALEHVLGNRRTVIIGTPGSGKSTFLEWLQLRIANADEEMILGGQQAIPLLLRVRQLDAKKLPQGVALIERATASKDRARLMPKSWIERQMVAGRVLLMVDGLDETEPELRDQYVLPWLKKLCAKKYANCAFVLSSRPTGYPPGLLSKLGFVECDLKDFGRPEIEEYCRHWCTAVRLAQNESEEEARREGQADGTNIVAGFEQNRYIRDLARSPLMLSAICLVNYFEGDQLPNDRAKLYQLCVEGLLHHWDQRRGIHSEFTLDEKLRVCREVAIAMQADNLAEYDGAKIQSIFGDVLGNAERAEALLEHIRYRTGLLLERRAGIYAFAHLTFQEYLAACAVHEGNRLQVDPQRMVDEHADGRWNEVMALYCGLAPMAAARAFIEQLIRARDSRQLADVLTECFFSAGKELSQDSTFRRTVIERVAVAPGESGDRNLARFRDDEVAPIANDRLGTQDNDKALSESFYWLVHHDREFDYNDSVHRLFNWKILNRYQLSEIVYVHHRFSPDNILKQISEDPEIYRAPGSGPPGDVHSIQADIALEALSRRKFEEPVTDRFQETLICCLRVFADDKVALRIDKDFPLGSISMWFRGLARHYAAATSNIDIEKKREVVELMQLCSTQISKTTDKDPLKALRDLQDAIERVASSRNG